VKIGVVVPADEADGGGVVPPWSTTRAFALAAEQQGLDSVWMYDHLFEGPDGDGNIQGLHEAWTLVGALAAVTERVEIGTIVLCTSFRSPGLTAKMAVAADAVSGGRIILGLGAGWHDPEYRAFGIPLDHRAARFEETLEILVPLLRGETVTFEGRYHRAEGAVLAPPPSRDIPILIASRRPRMLRLTARYADQWNTAWFGAPDEKLRERLSDLDRALQQEGRDPSEVARTVGIIATDGRTQTGDDGPAVRFGDSVDELASALDAYDELGIEHLIAVLQPMTEGSIERLATAVRLRGGSA
jgi:probable F420-dependent oxidoreductase